jgi:hypothetical protein
MFDLGGFVVILSCFGFTICLFPPKKDQVFVTCLPQLRKELAGSTGNALTCVSQRKQFANVSFNPFFLLLTFDLVT